MTKTDIMHPDHKILHKIILILIVISFSSFCYSQKYLYLKHYNIDSLLLILPDQMLEERVNTLNLLGVTHFYKDTKLSIQYTDEAISLAKELNYKEGMADAFRNYGLISFMQGNFSQALNNFLDALSLYEKTKMKRMVAQVYFDISATHYSAKNYEKALEYGYKSLDRYREPMEGGRSLGSVKDTVDVIACLGLVYKEMGEYEKALELALEYLKNWKEK